MAEYPPPRITEFRNNFRDASICCKNCCAIHLLMDEETNISVMTELKPQVGPNLGANLAEYRYLLLGVMENVMIMDDEFRSRVICVNCQMHLGWAYGNIHTCFIPVTTIQIRHRNRPQSPVRFTPFVHTE